MAIITIDAFATKCNIERKNLMTYVGRGAVILDGKKIDTNHEKNIAFFNKREAKGLTTPKGVRPVKTQIPREDTYVEPGEEQSIDADENGILPLPVSEKKKKHFDAIVAERNSELLKLKSEKMRGEVIPSELIKPVFLQHNQHILMAQKNADEEILLQFAHKYDIPGEDVAYIRGEWVKQRNAAVKTATDASIKGIETIVKDYSIKRGVGERN